jgi:DNA-directed RNA polymerase II subunit RPB1
MPTQTSAARAAGATSVGMQSENFGYSSARLRRVKKLQFGIVNPNELRQYSVTQAITVNSKKIPAGITRYETQINGQPVYGGANDPRLGSIHDKSDPGYFGHIDLAKPVYHQGFFNVMLKVLRCVCYHCSRLRMDETEFKFQKARAIRYVVAALARLYLGFAGIYMHIVSQFHAFFYFNFLKPNNNTAFGSVV